MTSGILARHKGFREPIIELYHAVKSVKKLFPKEKTEEKKMFLNETSFFLNFSHFKISWKKKTGVDFYPKEDVKTSSTIYFLGEFGCIFRNDAFPFASGYFNPLR